MFSLCINFQNSKNVVGVKKLFNFLFQNKIKGYISHQHQKLVVSKQNPFPPLATVIWQKRVGIQTSWILSKESPFLVAPSRRVERLIYSLWCLDGCMVGWLLTFRTKFRKFHRIWKIPKQDHVSRHSEQLWFLDPPPPPPPSVKGILENTTFGLTYVRTKKKIFFFKFFLNSNVFSSNFLTISQN